GKLKKIEVSGGPPITLCDATDFIGGSWSPTGVIVFAPRGTLQKVPAAGGAPTAATVLGQGETTHSRRFFLPDGRHFLYQAGRSSVTLTISLASLNSAERKLLF